MTSQYLSDSKPTKLSQFGTTQDSYGRMHEMGVAERKMNVLPLCYPRQAGKPGTANSQWGLLHKP
jgi:hypothetical protein